MREISWGETSWSLTKIEQICCLTGTEQFQTNKVLLMLLINDLSPMMITAMMTITYFEKSQSPKYSLSLDWRAAQIQDLISF